ncbi:MAG: DinB family protein [Acidimicrobiales bacterium]
MTDGRWPEEELEAYVLNQLDEEARTAFEQALTDHPDLTARADGFRRALAAVGGSEETAPPARLRSQLIDTALAGREPGRPASAEGGSASATAVYREVVDDTLRLIDDLEPGEMAATTIYRIPVVEMISHIGGTEAYLADRLGLVPYPGDIGDHVAVRDDGADLARPSDVVARWRETASIVGDRVAALGAEDLTSPVSFHGFPLTVSDVLIGRGFELWTHAEDICRATGRPLRPPSGPTLRTMADGAMTLLQMLLSLDGRHQGRSLRITLTGQGGGSWHWTIGADPEPPVDPAAPAEATLVDDVSNFCRLIAARVEPELRASQLMGDRSVLQTVLELAPSQADFGTGPVADRPDHPR